MNPQSLARATGQKYSAFRSYAARVTRCGGYPSTLWVEPTNICNLRCPMCPQSLGLRRPKGYMDTALFARLARDISGRVPDISLHFAGESLLHAEFPEFVRLAAENGIRTVLHTNATMLRGDLPERIIRAGLSGIVFSFDAISKEKYEAARVGASYDDTLDNILGFLRARQGLHSRTPFTTVKILQLFDSAPAGAPGIPAELKSRFRGLPVDRFFTEWAHVFGGMFAEETLGKARYAVPPAGRRYPCPLLWRGFAIGWNGDAFACCNDLNGEYALGRYPDTPLPEIWNGEPMMRLRETHAADRASTVFLCRECVVPFRPWRVTELIREIAADSIKRILYR